MSKLYTLELTEKEIKRIKKALKDLEFKMFASTKHGVDGVVLSIREKSLREISALLDKFNQIEL